MVNKTHCFGLHFAMGPSAVASQASRSSLDAATTVVRLYELWAYNAARSDREQPKDARISQA